MRLMVGRFTRLVRLALFRSRPHSSAYLNIHRQDGSRDATANRLLAGTLGKHIVIRA